MRAFFIGSIVALAGCRQPSSPERTVPPPSTGDAAGVGHVTPPDPSTVGTPAGDATMVGTPAGGATPGGATMGVLTGPTTVRSSRELQAHLVITNAGPSDLVLTRGAVDLATLALEVRDATDARVPTMSPPVPRVEDADPIVVRVGERLERDYRLDLFSPPLPPGRYTIHCRVVACAPLAFTVAP